MNEQQIWTFLKSKGFTDAGCAGIMGNLYAESGLNPQNMQNAYEKKLGMTDTTYTSAVDNGTYNNFIKDGVGYGLAQWTYWSRKQNLFNFCKQQNSSIGSLSAQLNFLYTELTTSYPNLVKLLKITSNVTEASNAVLLQFERPANQSDSIKNTRASYSQNFYNKFHVGSTPITSTSTMKYNDTNKPIVCMQTTSTCYKQTYKLPKVKGILIHSTGANNPNIARYVQPSDRAVNRQELLNIIGTNRNRNDWNHIYIEAGLNAWIGKIANGNVATVQTMPWDYAPWGCGPGRYGSCNSGWIQFEICEDNLQSVEYFNQIYQETIELVAYLCKMFNLNPHGTTTHCGVKNVPVILCHGDSYRLGLGSAHNDVLHWFPKYGKSMETVRNDVAAKLAGTNVNTNTNIPIKQEEEEDMTDERFNELMNNWLAKKANEKESWGTENLAWAQSHGIMNGDSAGRMMPNKFCTRLEVVTMLKRLGEKLGLK